MKELLTEDLLNSLRLIKYDRSRTLMENNLLVEQGSWDSKSGDNVYWVALYNRLKTFGVSPKYGNNGKQVTDPNTATFIYWGQWLIWKDLNKNGGYPIQLYSPSGSYTFKWKSGKYKGEELNKSIILCGQKKGIDFILTDLLPINDVTKAKKLIGYGGCKGMNETLLVGGVDVVKTDQLTKEFPHCFKKPSQNISKSDPLYNQKIDPKILTGEPKTPYMDYGGSVEYFVGNKKNDISPEAIKSRYESGIVNDLYELVYLPELGNKNKDIEDLKYNKEIVKIGNYETIIDEKDDKVRYGLNVYKRALQVRNSLAKTAGWSGPPTVKMDSSYALSYGDQTKFYEILNSPSSVAIDPTDLEVAWVGTKIRYLNEAVKEKEGNSFLIGNFENLERIKISNYGIPAFPQQRFNIPKNISLEKWFEQKEKEFNTTNTTNTNTWNIVKKEYKNRLNDYIKSQTKGATATKQMGILKRELSEYKTAMDLIYERNLSLSKQTANYINAACNTKIRTQVGVVNKDFQTDKATLDKLLPKDDDTNEYRYDNKWFIEFTIKDLCTSGKLGGVYTTTSEEKNRTFLKGIDWKKLKFVFVDEKRPDNITCFCSDMRIFEYEKIRAKGDLVADIYKIPKNPRQLNLVGSTLSQKLIVRKNFEMNLEPRKFAYNTADYRTFTQKALDWTKKCFTASNDKGEMGKDFHCLLDVASIAVTFIPVWGPLIAMVIDTLNAAYFYVDAQNADTNLDKNSAYFSAALTFIGGLASGFGDARALIKSGPNGLKILGYAENYMVKSAQIRSKGLAEDVLEKELKILMLEMNLSYKLTSKEMQLVQKYMNSIELLGKEQATKLLTNYKKSLDNLQSKIGFRRWEELMKNDMFIEFMKKADGNIFEALKLMNKKIIKREFWQQFGFFVGGESILPELINPPIMEKIKKGEWGTFEQQISLDNYDLPSVLQSFMIDNENDIDRLLIPAWNETCKKTPTENYCIKKDGVFKRWRPGYTVPLKYRTENYKKYLEEKKKQEELDKNFAEFFKETQESSDKFYDVKIMKNGKYINFTDELDAYVYIVPKIEKDKSKIPQMCDNTNYDKHTQLKKLSDVFSNLKKCKKENNTNIDTEDEEVEDKRSNDSYQKSKKIDLSF
jgi:hypothetical protein